MLLGVKMLAGFMAFITLLAFAMLAWALRDGQMDDVDEIAAIPLREREPEAWPGRVTADKEA